MLFTTVGLGRGLTMQTGIILVIQRLNAFLHLFQVYCNLLQAMILSLPMMELITHMLILLITH